MDFRERAVEWSKPRTAERQSYLARESQGVIDWILQRIYLEFGCTVLFRD